MTYISRDNPVDVEKAITALILSPSVPQAVEVMREQGYTCNEQTLPAVLARPSIRERYEQRREELAPVKERMFASDMLDNAELGAAVVRMALEQTQMMLATGVARDPGELARIARDVSQVSSQAIEKRLTVQGRPTQITEVRDVSEIVRALEGMKVVQVIEASSEDDTGA